MIRTPTLIILTRVDMKMFAGGNHASIPSCRVCAEYGAAHIACCHPFAQSGWTGGDTVKQIFTI